MKKVTYVQFSQYEVIAALDYYYNLFLDKKGKFVVCMSENNLILKEDK